MFNYPHMEEHTYTEFEIHNVREIAKTEKENIKIEETVLHYGGIQVKIFARTRQHLEFFLWELNKVISKQNDLNKTYHSKPQCESDDLVYYRDPMF